MQKITKWAKINILQKSRVLVKMIPQLFLISHSKNILLLKYYFLNSSYATISHITVGLPCPHFTHGENSSEEKTNTSKDLESNK